MEVIPQLPVVNGLYPPFEYKVLEDKGRYRIVRDAEGSICEVSKDSISIPRYIKHALKTRKDWEIFKRERLDYTRKDRIGQVKKVVEPIFPMFSCGIGG